MGAKAGAAGLTSAVDMWGWVDSKLQPGLLTQEEDAVLNRELKPHSSEDSKPWAQCPGLFRHGTALLRIQVTCPLSPTPLRELSTVYIVIITYTQLHSFPHRKDFEV